MKPYYDDGQVAIYCADAREVLPELPRADLMLTDPPYGVGMNYASYVDTRENWRALMESFLPMVRGAAAMAIMPAGPMEELGWVYTHFPPDWLMCWYKGSPGTLSFVGFNDWEPLLVYGKGKGVQMHDYFQVSSEPFTNGHPCAKPVRWATWLIERAAPVGGIVLDPFMGSGTTLVAAAALGRKAIGIEIEERYCEIAVQRLAQATLFGPTAPTRHETGDDAQDTPLELFGAS